MSKRNDRSNPASYRGTPGTLHDRVLPTGANPLSCRWVGGWPTATRSGERCHAPTAALAGPARKCRCALPTKPSGRVRRISPAESLRWQLAELDHAQLARELEQWLFRRVSPEPKPGQAVPATVMGELQRRTGLLLITCLMHGAKGEQREGFRLCLEALRDNQYVTLAAELVRQGVYHEPPVTALRDDPEALGTFRRGLALISAANDRDEISSLQVATSPDDGGAAEVNNQDAGVCLQERESGLRSPDQLDGPRIDTESGDPPMYVAASQLYAAPGARVRWTPPGEILSRVIPSVHALCKAIESFRNIAGPERPSPRCAAVAMYHALRNSTAECREACFRAFGCFGDPNSRNHQMANLSLDQNAIAMSLWCAADRLAELFESPTMTITDWSLVAKVCDECNHFARLFLQCAQAKPEDERASETIGEKLTGMADAQPPGDIAVHPPGDKTPTGAGNTEHANNSTILSPHELTILSALVARRTTMLQVDIERQSGLSHAVVSEHVKSLLGKGFVVRPAGKRRGLAITDSGRKLVPRPSVDAN